MKMVIDKTLNRWRSQSSEDLTGQEIISLCHSIIELLASERFENVEHFSFALFFSELNISNNESDLAKLMRVLDYLSSGRLHLLEMKYLLHDEEYSEPLYLDSDLVNHAFFEGVLYHPNTGEPVDNYKAKIFPYFVQSQELKRAHS